MHIDAHPKARGRARAVPANQMTLFDFASMPPADGGMTQAAGPAPVAATQLDPSPRAEQATHAGAASYMIVAQNGAPMPRRRSRKPIYADRRGADQVEVGGEIERNAYFRIVNDMKLGDQQPLRVLWKAAELEGVNVAQLALNEEALTILLGKHRLHKNAPRYARQILICLSRAVESCPEFLNGRYKPVTDSRIHLIPEACLPDAFRHDLSKWLTMTPVKVAGAANLAEALAEDTIETYVRAASTGVAALELAGVSLDPDVGIQFLIQPSAVALWLPIIQERDQASTVCSILAALLRIARDLPGSDASAISHLEARLSHLMKGSLALDMDRVGRLDAWAQPANLACLVDASDNLMRSAMNPTESRRDRLIKGASAVAYRLMSEHPGLTERDIANFDTRVHIEGPPGSRCVLRSDPGVHQEPAPVARFSEPISPAAEQLIDDLLELRRILSVKSTLLLPGNDGLPRAVRAAMEAIYNQIQGVLGERLTLSDLRDLNTYIMLRDTNADTSAIAAATGYKHPRSLQRRFDEVEGMPGRGEARP